MIDVRDVPSAAQELIGAGLVPGQRGIGKAMAAVADIGDLEPHVGSQLLLDTDVEGLAVAQPQRARIHTYGERESWWKDRYWCCFA